MLKRPDDDPEARLEELILDVEPSEAEYELITEGLRKNLVCSALKPQEIEALSREISLYHFDQGSHVCREGDMGNHFFIVNEGEFEVSIGGKVVSVLRRGNTFGEIALIHNVPRSATITCATKEGTTWGVGRQQFRDVLKQLSTRNFAENRKFLEQVKILEILTEAQKTMITNALVEQKFADTTPIISEGQSGDELFIIKTGKCGIYIQNRWVRELGTGDYFGERALLYDEVRSATVSAEGPVTVLSIGRELLSTVLGNLQHVLFRNMMVIAVNRTETFQNFSSEQLDGIIQAMVVKDYPENYTIMDRTNRAKDVRYFIVLEGSVLISKDNYPIQTLERGDSYGEEYVGNLSLPFAHRVDSIEPTKLGMVTVQQLNKCLGSTDMQRTLEHNLKKRVMQRIYIFKYLTNLQFDTLIENINPYHFKKGETIFLEGDSGNELLIIKEGEVEIVLDSKPGTGGPLGKSLRIRTSGKHDYFGERALLYNEPRSASIYCTSDTVELWSIEKPVFQSVMQGTMLKHLEERIEMQNTRISFFDLVNVAVIGRGTYGVVREVYVKTNPRQRYALKANSRYHSIQQGMTDMVRYEREIMAECDHPFIIKLVKCFKDEKYLYFLQELSKGGELYDAMRKIGICSFDQTRFYVASITLALEYLHDRSIIFRDLKPENILLDETGYIKIIDFGCAKKLQAARTYTMMGTPHYMAPEQILGKGYGLSVDIWALGITMYEMLCGVLPFELEDIDEADQLEVFRHILSAKLSFPTVSKLPQYHANEAAENFVRRMLTRVPEFRLGCGPQGFKQIKTHEFFAGSQAGKDRAEGAPVEAGDIEPFDFEQLITRNVKVPIIPVIAPSPTEEGGTCSADNSGLDDIPKPDLARVPPFNDDWDSGFEIIPDK